MNLIIGDSFIGIVSHIRLRFKYYGTRSKNLVLNLELNKNFDINFLPQINLIVVKIILPG